MKDPQIFILLIYIQITILSLFFPPRTFTQNAQNLKKALCAYEHLLSEQRANMQSHITELGNVADTIDHVKRGVKIAHITGGTAGALGVVAAVGGVILAPVTMGASLAVTAIGVGVAAAGGVTGASAAITNKVHSNMDRKKVETILKEHCNQIEKIERCVKMINVYIECLKKYDLSKLKGVQKNEMKMAKIAHNLGNSLETIGAISRSTGVIHGFTLGIDMYFSQDDSEQLKKDKETKFARQIRKISKHMQTSLDELIKFYTNVKDM